MACGFLPFTSLVHISSYENGWVGNKENGNGVQMARGDDISIDIWHSLSQISHYGIQLLAHKLW
ncbi:hypothetical protein BKA66DRAFT_50694 [Pyrenochaeta sp. MPI-SDFR-AT-0127]|nr:hypothetical protein BKA66DRAFT_50694 [Pyrenochaeta sp. MPI-SDFR-AT-0127]